MEGLGDTSALRLSKQQRDRLEGSFFAKEQEPASISAN